MESTFHGIIAFALLSMMLILGNVLRNKISFLKRNLIPSSLIGGILGFGLLNLGLLPQFTSADFVAITFHCFTLSFMSLCLCGGLRKKKTASNGSKNVVRGGMWLTSAWSLSLGLQGLIGIGAILAFNAFTGGELSYFLGSIITHGFTQGPGQALTYGTIWEQKYGIIDAAQVGVIYASLGFVVAFVVGIPLAKHFLNKGMNSNEKSKIDNNYINGLYEHESKPESGKLVTHSANLDSLAYHIGLLGSAYVLTYLWLGYVQSAIAGLSIWGIDFTVLFSFNMFFIHGFVTCLIMRTTMNKLGLCRTVDDETLKRITGSSVDFMVAGTIMSIQVSVLAVLIVPILLVTILTALSTFITCMIIGRFSGYLGPERIVTAFGCCCGSTGTGLLLLRMLDSNFDTAVAKELAFFNVAIVMVNFPILMVFSPIAPSLSLLGYIGLLSSGVVMSLLMILGLIYTQSSRRITPEVVAHG
ncbi:sodium:glutamate symporter [Vibrio sp. 10N.286.49.B3]|uniref:sodium/glutamate symporter n=1 Tax=Vibrio sp. 10N.286.49.B3 TaxID=1880855 RepID=UPI000CC5328C|nr:sodium/glutamate symporter [Vibrio sp. 10N.286.49.B3]PMH42220.1 sodium:glutamate symporter [Vibrio sp. 10N.286.49.B3]